MKIVLSVGERLEQGNCLESLYFGRLVKVSNFYCKEVFLLGRTFLLGFILEPSRALSIFFKRTTRHAGFSSAQVYGVLSLAMTTYKSCRTETNFERNRKSLKLNEKLVAACNGLTKAWKNMIYVKRNLF